MQLRIARKQQKQKNRNTKIGKDIEIYSDDEISKFRAWADEIQKEIDVEVNTDE